MDPLNRDPCTFRSYRLLSDGLPKNLIPIKLFQSMGLTKNYSQKIKNYRMKSKPIAVNKSIVI